MAEQLDSACQAVVEKTQGAVACGVVDLDSGALIGLFNGAGYPDALNEVVAAATVDLFRGPNVQRVEQLVRQHRRERETGEHYFEEVHISSANNFHFAKTIKQGQAAVVLVTRKTTTMGMGWANLKGAVPELERWL